MFAHAARILLALAVLWAAGCGSELPPACECSKDRPGLQVSVEQPPPGCEPVRVDIGVNLSREGLSQDDARCALLREETGVPEILVFDYPDGTRDGEAGMVRFTVTTRDAVLHGGTSFTAHPSTCEVVPLELPCGL